MNCFLDDLLARLHATQAQHWRLLGGLLPLALVLGLLNGCSTNAKKTQYLGTNNQFLTNWQIRGKVGLKRAENGGQGQINWKQQGQAYNLRINGPFGRGNVSISGDSSLATIRLNGEPPRVASQPEDLVLEATGLQIPITSLTQWITGAPAPASKAKKITYNDDGSIQSFLQDGWRLDFSRYRQEGSWYLPRKIIASREDDDIRVQLVINQWQF